MARKYPSGAAKVRMKRAREEADRAEELVRRGGPPPLAAAPPAAVPQPKTKARVKPVAPAAPAPPPPEQDSVFVGMYADQFAKLGDPDLANPTSGLEYARKVALLALKQIATDPLLPSRERWRMLKDQTAVIGMTHAKGAVESQLAALKRKRDQDVGEDPHAGMEKAGDITRPATARRTRPGSVGDAVPGPPARAERGDEPRDAAHGGRAVGSTEEGVH